METLDSINYKGHTIKVVIDNDPENPQTAWEGNYPLVIESGRWGQNKDYSNGDILDYLVNFLNYNQVIKHQKWIMDVTCSFHIDRDKKRLGYTSDDTHAALVEALREWMDGDIYNMEIFAKKFNIKHYCSVSTGYSQGDYFKAFTCWTPAFAKITGVEYDAALVEGMKGSFDTYAAYAWGDVYGYVIEDNNDNVDMCFGYYGDDGKDSMIKEAKDIIDSTVARAWKDRLNTLKTLIRNHVPLLKRAALLA